MEDGTYDKIVPIAQSYYAGERVIFGIKTRDRLRHLYVLGKTGYGKSIFLNGMAAHDLAEGEGFAFFDTTGKSADDLLDRVTYGRVKDVVYYEPLSPGDVYSGYPEEFLRIIDGQKIFIANIARRRFGEQEAKNLARRLVQGFYSAALLRSERSRGGKLSPFFIYMDDCHLFADPLLISFASDARKGGISLTLAHQHSDQMSEEMFRSLIGTMGTIVAFRVGHKDAEILEKYFAPKFIADDLLGSEVGKFYTNMMVDGKNLPLFSGRVIPLPDFPERSYKSEITKSIVYPDIKIRPPFAEETREISEKVLKETILA